MVGKKKTIKDIEKLRTCNYEEIRRVLRVHVHVSCLCTH